eukprot:8613640-Pyramimonas_sp.AAC.1
MKRALALPVGGVIDQPLLETILPNAAFPENLCPMPPKHARHLGRPCHNVAALVDDGPNARAATGRQLVQQARASLPLPLHLERVSLRSVVLSLQEQTQCGLPGEFHCM